MGMMRHGADSIRVASDGLRTSIAWWKMSAERYRHHHTRGRLRPSSFDAGRDWVLRGYPDGPVVVWVRPTRWRQGRSLTHGLLKWHCRSGAPWGIRKCVV